MWRLPRWRSALGRTLTDASWYEKPGAGAGTADRPVFRWLLAYCEEHPTPNERMKLTPGPEAEVRFIRWLYETYASGKVALAELTRRAPSGYPKRWIRRTLHQLLLNPVYSGDIVYDMRARDGVPDPITVRDVHVALVSRETIAGVHAILARNRKETHPTRGGYPLSGFGCRGRGRHDHSS